MSRQALQARRTARSGTVFREEQKPALIDIFGATFYRDHPSPSSTSNTGCSALFPGLNFSLPSFANPKEHWAVLGSSASARTAFLEVLRSKYICLPPTARTYPYLSTHKIQSENPHLRNPTKAIQYVGFDAERGGLGGSTMRGAYLSARYEARKEEMDFSLLDFLKGNTELNPDENLNVNTDDDLLARVLNDLKLEGLLDMPVSNLSNGQTRRAKIAKSLMNKPVLLLLDGPFMGLDPPTSKLLSSLLNQLAEACNPRILLSLRPQDIVPDWLTHLICVNEDFKISAQGSKSDVLAKADNSHIRLLNKSITTDNAISQRAQSLEKLPSEASGIPVIEMLGVQVKYGSRCVLGGWQQGSEGKQQEGLWWTVRKGQRWGVFGSNGSGKTTLLSLITSDHPQTYSVPMRLFQRSRLPSRGNPGISIFDIQSRIGHSSPEVHTYFPRSLSVRRAMESAWADAPLSKPTKLTDEGREKVNACLRWFQTELYPEAPKLDFSISNSELSSISGLRSRYDGEIMKCGSLSWASKVKFGELAFSAQRVVLFLRAIIRNPEIVILDEALSGMDESAREKCAHFLSYGERSVLWTPEARSAEARFVPSLQSQLGLVQVPGLRANQALLVVSHLKEEVPDCVREWITLPEPGTRAPRIGRLKGPVSLEHNAWSEIWGMDV
ncbi:hypothetical protein EV356DRAFT_496008 [Viridothelium virens]|uniref:ABC transporter domain-containing protein n=1 Tax=Viridothelium virens TaxID=1048519 RepID=A0A6A6HRR5_VIRVR|nr:hypothetical protein EV356DRAFT_496008 [Viridothelium virens]